MGEHGERDHDYDEAAEDKKINAAPGAEAGYAGGIIVIWCGWFHQKIFNH